MIFKYVILRNPLNDCHKRGLSLLGFKVKKDFSTEFPDSIDAKWGFHNGRDVAVVRYPSIELAKSSGYILSLIHI